MNALLQVNLHTGVQENRKRTILVRAYNVACKFDSIRCEIFEKEKKNGSGGELIDRRSFTVRLDTDVRLYNFEKKRLS